jgi:hypothetical protein
VPQDRKARCGPVSVNSDGSIERASIKELEDFAKQLRQSESPLHRSMTKGCEVDIEIGHV